jgi:hypothetical protein
MLTPQEQPPGQKKGRGLPIGITVLCGIALAAGSCFGFLKTWKIAGASNPINTVFAIGFGVGVLTVVVMSVVGLVRFVVSLWNRVIQRKR